MAQVVPVEAAVVTAEPAKVEAAAPVVAAAVVGAAAGAAIAGWSDANLASLVPLDTLNIQQEVNVLEAVADAVGFGCCEQPNVYHVYDGKADAASQKPGEAAHLLTIKEEGNECKDMVCRVCFNPFHTMTLQVTDAKTTEPVFWIDRPFRCCGCAYLCCSCCLQEWNVMSGSSAQGIEGSSMIGSLRQPICGGGCFPRFNIFDGPPSVAGGSYGDKTPAMIIRGPHFIGELCCDVNFRLMAPKGPEPGAEEVQLGNITKLGAKDGMGALKELLTDADTFAMTVPHDASVTTKATAITGLVLLDYYFFESGGALECNPLAGPGETYCKLNVCTEYYCGTLVPWTISCKKGESN